MNTITKLKKGLFGAATLALLMGTVSGCKKDDNNTNTNTASPSAPIPPVTDADGVLVAVNTQTITTAFGFTSTLTVGTAVGVFGTLSGTPNYLEVGTITATVASTPYTLTKQSNNAYVYVPSQTSPTGIDFGSSIDWSVAGGNGFAAFTQTINQGFPDIDTITSATSGISSSAAYTLTTNSISNSDSVIFQIAGNKGNVLVTLPSNSRQHTFTAADMAKVGTGSAFLQIAPYNYQSHIHGGKNIYFVNETVVTKAVTID